MVKNVAISVVATIAVLAVAMRIPQVRDLITG